jgi:transcriptional regulator with XRE-family HTH domain
MTDIRKILGNNIRKLRKSKGFSQEYLAEQVGLATQQINRIENGHQFPKYITITHLAEVLGVDTLDLFSTEMSGIIPVQNISIQRFYQNLLDEFEGFVKKHIGELEAAGEE